ncbi:O-antigen ligase family protein [Marinobacter sp.]|uniref:O-antigen ligase family protein n=1 Tax=Marinobacter sp. TaxID=50741 RepID=UPI002B2782CD|nr:O-antigen ligase family protein [Marinobacter sp.]
MFRADNFSILSRFVGFAIFFYLATLAIVPDVYGYAPALMLLAALGYWRTSEIVKSLDRRDRLFVFGYLAYGLVFVVLVVLHKDDLSGLDRPSRFVAAAIILTMLLRISVSARLVFTGAALGGICSGLFAGHEVWVSDVSRVASFDNAIYFGNGALILALISLGGGLSELQKRPSHVGFIVLYSSGMIGGIAGLLLSGTRGGWLAVPVITLVGLWTYRRTLARRPKMLAVSLIVIIALGVAAVNMKVVSDRGGAAVSEVQLYFSGDRINSSVGLRLEMWKAGAILFANHPVVGVGEKRFHTELEQLVDSGLVGSGILTFRHLHNQFLDHAAKGGILAVFALLLVFGIPMALFWRYLKSTDPEIKACAFVGVTFTLSFVVFCLTQGMFSRNIGVMMYVIVPLFLWALIRQVEGKAVQSQDSDLPVTRRLD